MADAPERQVVLVDGRDQEEGLAEIRAAHGLPGQRHRAFTALLLDPAGRLLLARRAAPKPLWADHWDGTVASHPLPGEGHREAGERRLPEELGVSARLHAFGRFEYHLRFGELGAENEVCSTLVGVLTPDAALAPDPSEVSELRWMDHRELLTELLADMGSYCPWLPLALLSLARNPGGSGERDLDRLLAPWLPAIADSCLEETLASHFPKRSWRFLDEEGELRLR